MAAPSTTMDNKQPTEPSPAQQSISSPAENIVKHTVSQKYTHTHTHNHNTSATQTQTQTHKKEIFNTAACIEGKPIKSD